jgi:hypothetical protein
MFLKGENLWHHNLQLLTFTHRLSDGRRFKIH